jgi:hypothetical protein
MAQDAQNGVCFHPPAPARQDALFTGRPATSDDPRAYVVRYVEGRSDVRTKLAGIFSVLLVDPPAGPYPSKDAINQPGDAKLRRHESFDRRDLTDIQS